MAAAQITGATGLGLAVPIWIGQYTRRCHLTSIRSTGRTRGSDGARIQGESPMTRPTRRQFLRYSAAVASAAALSPRFSFADGPPEYVRFPEKTDLLLLTDRPPNLETPLKYFREDL